MAHGRRKREKKTRCLAGRLFVAQVDTGGGVVDVSRALTRTSVDPKVTPHLHQRYSARIILKKNPSSHQLDVFLDGGIIERRGEPLLRPILRHHPHAVARTELGRPAPGAFTRLPKARDRKIDPACARKLTMDAVETQVTTAAVDLDGPYIYTSPTARGGGR